MSLKVLVVEDEAMIAINLATLLEEMGHSVIGPAASSREALTLVEQQSPDLAFVDLTLKDGKTGLSVAQRLAANHGAVVVVVSATTDGLREGESGIFRIVKKPYTDEGIVEITKLVEHTLSRTNQPAA